ncbi:MAG: transposase [Aphanocapsa lilacina HA4352-LM1]|jgi:transposase|nr:transposase [Aphanocapsa lilacina HA4352-LM1]
MALLGWLGNYAHLSDEKQAEFIETLCGVRLPLGTLVSVNERLARTVQPSVPAAWAYLREARAVYVDETPWPVIGSKEWLWQFGTEPLSLFHAGDTRGRVELVARLGEVFGGTLLSDDFSADNGYAVAAQHKCLAHLLRHSRKWKNMAVGSPQGWVKRSSVR